VRVNICAQKDSCCYKKGSESLKASRERFPKLEISESGCLGICKTVVAEIDGKLYSELTADSLAKLINEKLKG